jgi:Nse1 non-SMC component of SMC5-6 complex
MIKNIIKWITVVIFTIFFYFACPITVKYEKIFNEALLKINDALSYVQFELRACKNQYDGKIYYGVVNNVADDQSKLGTKYTAPQIAFYKGVVHKLLLTFNFLLCYFYFYFFANCFSFTTWNELILS